MKAAVGAPCRVVREKWLDRLTWGKQVTSEAGMHGVRASDNVEPMDKLPVAEILELPVACGRRCERA